MQKLLFVFCFIAIGYLLFLVFVAGPAVYLGEGSYLKAAGMVGFSCFAIYALLKSDITKK